MSKNTGGPAFPEQQGTDVHGEKYSIGEGMSMRDYFAAKALPALIEQGIVATHVASAAYRFADMMLAERAK